MGSGHHKRDNDFYNIPSTLLFLSFTSELQEYLVAKLLSWEEGRYLTIFCRGSGQHRCIMVIFIALYPPTCHIFKPHLSTIQGF